MLAEGWVILTLADIDLLESDRWDAGGCRAICLRCSRPRQAR